MQPWPVGAEDKLACTGALHCLLQYVEAADPRRVGVDVWMTHQVVNERRLRSPIVCKAPQVRNNERHLRILRGQQLHDCYLAHHVVEHGQCEGPGCLTYLTGDPPI